MKYKVFRKIPAIFTWRFSKSIKKYLVFCILFKIGLNVLMIFFANYFSERSGSFKKANWLLFLWFWHRTLPIFYKYILFYRVFECLICFMEVTVKLIIFCQKLIIFQFLVSNMAAMKNLKNRCFSSAVLLEEKISWKMLSFILPEF